MPPPSAPTAFDAADIVTAVGVFVGAISLVVGVINARRDQNAKRMEREADTLQLMNGRFQQMAAMRRALDDKTRSSAPITAAEVYDFYASYWALQIDQWEHYRLGVISRDVYVTWLCYLFDTLAGFHRIGDLDSRASWEQIGRSLSRNNIEFRILAEQLYELSDTHREGLNRQSGGGEPLDRLTLREKIRNIVLSTPVWIRSGRLGRKQRKLLESPLPPLHITDTAQ